MNTFTLYHGDCAKLMRAMPASSVDMILTDPPYGIKYKSNARTKSEKFGMLKNDDNASRFGAYAEFHRILKSDSVCIVFASYKNIADDVLELRKYFDIKNIIVWWKHGGGMGDLRHSLSTDYELAIVCHKGRAALRKRLGMQQSQPKQNAAPDAEANGIARKNDRVFFRPGNGCSGCVRRFRRDRRGVREYR